MSKRKLLLAVSILFYSIGLVAADDGEILKKELNKLFPNCKISEQNNSKDYSLIYEIMIPQQWDHNDPAKGVFFQKVLLYHKGFKNANLLVTEGYESRDRVYELAKVLNSNQFIVEYRYFGKSLPPQQDWSLLNHYQALRDLHYIQNKLAKLYKKKWASTGVSKGGTTTALYKLTFPKDVALSVAYVAPFPIAQEDPRTIAHYKKEIGTEECRNKISQFQKSMLKKREEIRPMLEQLAITDSVSFSLGLDKTIDYACVEYPFSFWQWSFPCNEIPDSNASATEIFRHIEEVVDFNYYDDKTCAQFLPAYYQFMTEFGYYGFDTTGLSELLIYENSLSNLEFCPKNTSLKFRENYMQSMKEQATYSKEKIIYIYGENDTWTSCGIIPDKTSGSMRFVKKGGGHRTKIKDLAPEDQNQINKMLKKYMKVKLAENSN